MADKPDKKPQGANGAMDMFKGKVDNLAPPSEWGDIGAAGAMITSLDKTQAAARKRILTALDGEPDTLASVINVPIKVAGVTIHPVAFPDDETGEITQAVRTVLHCADGKDYACVSKGALRSLLLICNLFGNPPWQEPLTVTPRRLPTSGGRSRYMLEMAE